MGNREIKGWEDPEGRLSKQESRSIEPLACRFHDLRHTAVSRMLNAGVPIAKVAKIVGWSTATMVRMAARYRHFTWGELREAIETISLKSEGTVLGKFPGTGSTYLGWAC